MRCFRQCPRSALNAFWAFLVSNFQYRLQYRSRGFLLPSHTPMMQQCVSPMSACTTHTGKFEQDARGTDDLCEAG